MATAADELVGWQLEPLIDLALREDLQGGDLTSEACVDVACQGSVTLRARQPAVVACLGVVEAVYRRLSSQVEVTRRVREGAQVEAGDVLAELSGPAWVLLAGERLALNLLQRGCAVATQTRRYVDALPPSSKTRIVDTRKTTPGLRALERYAVRRGGGANHRNDLGSSILIKDNHIAFAGGVARAIARARQRAPHTSCIECEVDAWPQLEEAVQARADIVLLDNFADEDVARAVTAFGSQIVLEASGGITIERVATLARLGVDCISVGALTHSVPAVDLGMDFESIRPVGPVGRADV